MPPGMARKELRVGHRSGEFSPVNYSERSKRGVRTSNLSPLARDVGVIASRCNASASAMNNNSRTRALSLLRALTITICMAICSPAWAQQQAGPEFEVAAIRPSGDCVGGGQPQPGRLSLRCLSLGALIQLAYGYFANGVSYSPTLLHVRGAPAWVSSDHYDITATAKGNLSQAMMRGPMLRALLEDRFQLQFHRASEEGPVYFLTAVKTGVKMERLTAKGCVPVDLQPVGNSQNTGTEVCGTETRKKAGSTISITVHGASVSALADGLLSELAERTVIDKSGLTGLFDVQLQYTPEQEGRQEEFGTRKTDETGSTSLFTAVQEQLGLKLTAGKGPVQVFVIDRVKRPSPN